MKKNFKFDKRKKIIVFDKNLCFRTVLSLKDENKNMEIISIGQILHN